jgi:2-polyprenyl-6-methoxyphenol hydroxylase-like FAD-dependent oxidoreductase
MVGDAAYCMMGMGTSLAMIGGYMIAGELAKAHTASTSDISAALKRYEDGLKPFVKKTQWKPPGVPQIMNPQTAWGITVLHWFLWLVGKSGLADKLIAPGEEKKDGWRAPDYGWAAARDGRLRG